MDEVKKKKKFRLFYIPLAIILLFIFTGLFVVIWDAPARDELKNIVIADVSFDNLNDGIYTGEYRGTKNSFRDVKVEVTVESGAITKIAIVKSKEDDKRSDELNKDAGVTDLLTGIIDAQSLETDAISGATLTTNAILKAIEDALLKAKK